MALQVTISATNNGASGAVRSVSSSWSTARNASVGESATTPDNLQTYTELSAGSYFIRRGFTTFNLATIPSSAAIDAVVFSGYILLSGFHNSEPNSFHVVEGTQSSILTTSDFDNVVFTSCGSLALASVTTNAYNNITLNSTGIALVKSKLGSTLKIATLIGQDLNNTPPSGANASEVDIRAASSVNPPKITITYRLPGAAYLA